MPKLTMVQAINLALHQEMERDNSVLVMGEDVGVNGGVFRATDGLIDKFGAQRAIDTPLAESGIIGTAIGMAINGLKPVLEMQFSGFSYLQIPQLEEMRPVCVPAAVGSIQFRWSLVCPTAVAFAHSSTTASRKKPSTPTPRD